MRDKKRKNAVIVLFLFYFFILFIGLKAAPYITDAGPGVLVEGITADIEKHPLKITLCNQTGKVILAVSAIYFVIAVSVIDSIKNYRTDEEFGSAKWASWRELNKKYQAKENIFPDIPMWRQSMILTEHARMGYDFYRPEHQKNANTLIWGGPGTWKSRGYIMPNIMQMNTSFVVTDPKGEIAKKLGHMLKQNGFEVKVFDISNPEKSICYNPFRYFRNDMDILKFVTNFFEATHDKNAQKGEDFWEKQAMNLMLAFCYLLYHEAPEEEQNLSMVLSLLHDAKVKDDDSYISPVDLLFKRLEIRNPEHIAVGYYKDYHVGAAKTLQSIQSTLASKLAYFNMDAVSKLTMTDEIDIRSFAEKKTALFCITPDSSASLNFLVGTLYQQMFEQLYDLADNVYNGPLPLHIRFYLDEFANVALPDDYQKILSTSRSRNISFAIVLQDKSQIEKLYDTIYKTLMACCSEWLFLGSNEKETCEYFSALCGKETIDVKSYSRSYGRNANYTVNVQKQQRDLITPDEMRRKANRIAILIIEGENALMDEKYNMKRHKFYKYVAEGKNLTRKDDPAEIFDWGNVSLSSGLLSRKFTEEDYRNAVDLDRVKSNVKIYDSEEYLKIKNIA